MFCRPVARRLASKLAIAPLFILPMNSTASSTVLLPFLPSWPGMSRSLMNVGASEPVTSTTSSPVMKRAMSMMCALRSPCAPLPASSFLNRHRSGVDGPPQSCR